MENLYTRLDFENLTSDDIKKIVEVAALDIPEEENKQDYIFKNRENISCIPEAKKLISQKVFAGFCAIKWFTFEYDGDFSQQKLIEYLEGNENNYNVKAVDLIGTITDSEIVSISKDDVVYTLKLVIKDGIQRIADAMSYRAEPKWSTVIVKIDVNNNWVEIRANMNLCKAAKRILIKRLHFKELNEIPILNKYNSDVSKFKDDLYNGFYLRYKAMPTEAITLTEDNSIALGKIINALDEYFVNNNSKELIKKLDEIDTDMTEISLKDIILAGIDKMSVKIRSNSESDMTQQALYSLLKENITENTSYIKFDMKHDKVVHTNTIQIGKTTNSITFRNSVTENDIEYIRQKVI